MMHNLQREAHQSTLHSIFEAAVAAVAPDGAVLRHMHLQGDSLMVDGREYPLGKKKILVLGGGKGAAPMAAAVENLLGERIDKGLVVVKRDHGLPLKHIELMEASHPVPDEAGVQATRAMLDMASTADENTLAICLFTGGASALTPAPAPGLTLEDLQKTTNLLLQCGSPIHEINALRKHLSVFSGGQLVRALAPASVLCLIVSDVIGDDLDVIASGPTAPDASTFATCEAIVARYVLEQQLPKAVREHLQRGLRGQIHETPKPHDAIFASVHNVLVATNAQALDAAATKAAELGYKAHFFTKVMQGEARDQAMVLLNEAKRLRENLKPGDKPLCLLAGGETTVTLRGDGLGGRNQEMALAAALAMEGEKHIAALFAGTDGTDGPTEAAGGFAHGDSASRIRAHADPQALLESNNSNYALQCGGDLLVTGPTRTNVMDVAALLIHG